MAPLFGFGKKKNKIKQEKELTNEKGIIGEYYEDGFPVILKFENELPIESLRFNLPIMTVISWEYDGSNNNGMPNEEIREKMVRLEAAISLSKSNSKLYKHAYSRTGNNLKELIYYTTSQNDFMKNLNTELSHHEKYPIEISFYMDKEWSEFRKLLEDFKINDDLY